VRLVALLVESLNLELNDVLGRGLLAPVGTTCLLHDFPSSGERSRACPNKNSQIALISDSTRGRPSRQLAPAQCAPAKPGSGCVPSTRA
jgi:hypothetical protein